MRVRVSVVARGLENPWSIAFLPDGTHAGHRARRPAARRFATACSIRSPWPARRRRYFAGESGLPGAVHGYMDVVLHPRFAENRSSISATPSRSTRSGATAAVARGRWDGKGITDMKDIFVLDEGTGGAVAAGVWPRRIAVPDDDRRNTPQDPNTQAGKVLRIKDDGSIPMDNPFVGKPDHKPEVFTLGHRSSLGLAMHPGTGEIWQNENGPNGGDEINILKPGANYGWPVVSYGRTYPGAWQSDRFWHEGFEHPIVYWTPSIAVSGMTFYTGTSWPKWKGDVFVGALRTGEIPGTGHLERILFNEKMEELRRESLLTEFRQRIATCAWAPTSCCTC